MSTREVEIATLTREGSGDKAKTLLRVLTAKEVDDLIADYLRQVEEKKQEKERLEKEKAAAAAAAAKSS